MHIHLRRIGFVSVFLLLVGLLLPTPVLRADAHSLFGRSADFADMLYSPDPVVTPDKQFVVFRADLETDGVYNVYRVPVAGGQPQKLSGAVMAGRGVRGFTLSPDGSRVVYTSSQDVENRDELYSVAVTGGQPVKLSGPLPTGGNVGSFRIAATNALVVYLADQTTNDVQELWSVPLAGGTPKKLNSMLVAGGDVLDDYGISPNTQFVVYRADQEVNDRYEVYSVPIGGGAVQKLNIDLGTGGQVDYFRMNLAFNAAIYVAKKDSASVYELYSVFLSGSQIAKLNGALPTGQRVTYIDITPDGQRVTYVVGKGFGSAAAGKLYSVAFGGGASIQLSPTPGVDGDVAYTRLSVDSKYAVFSFQPKSTDPLTFYSATLDTGTRVTLYNVAANHGIYDLALSPDSAWVVFTDADQTPQARASKIYAVPLGGGALVQLSANNEHVYSPLISPQSDRVLFSGYAPNSLTCPESNLHSAQIFGGGRRDLTDLCGMHSNINYAGWIKDGMAILYHLEYDVFENGQSQDRGFELFISDGQALAPTATPTPSVTPTTPTTPTSLATTTPTASTPATTRQVFLPLVQR